MPASVPRALAGRCAPTSTTGCSHREGQVQKERSLLQCRGAVRNDKAGDRRLFARNAMDQRPDLDPILGADIGAADLPEGHRNRIGDKAGFGKPFEQRLACQLLPEIGIIQHIEA